jgi:hypothetical protein
MRIAQLLVVLIGVAAAGPALAGPPDDPAAATSVTILRGSSAPTEAYTPPPKEVVREVVYLPAYYPSAYAYYMPAYYLTLPLGIVRQHRHVATSTATMMHRK